MPPKKYTDLSVYLPRMGLSALILCIISGIILTFYYRPMGNVFQNVEEITTLVPYGWFFRQFHYASGQLFVIFMLIHTGEHCLKRRYRFYSAIQWTFLILSLALCFFTLFTGFILKGDKEGLFAGQIFMNIVRTIPLTGRPLSLLFIEQGEGFYFLPYLQHCFFGPLAIITLLRGHIAAWLPGHRFVVLTGAGLFLFALVVRPGMDIPPDAPVATVKGPWFFLGLQTLLKLMSPGLAGLLIPGVLVGMLLLLPVARGMWARALHYTALAAWAVYGLITLRAIIWHP